MQAALTGTFRITHGAVLWQMLSTACQLFHRDFPSENDRPRFGLSSAELLARASYISGALDAMSAWGGGGSGENVSRRYGRPTRWRTAGGIRRFPGGACACGCAVAIRSGRVPVPLLTRSCGGTCGLADAARGRKILKHFAGASIL
jgi:hypothetical protein